MATAKKAKKVSRASLMRQYYNGNPDATVKDAAKKFKTSYQIAYMAKRGIGHVREEPHASNTTRMKLLSAFTSDKSITDLIREQGGPTDEEMMNAPPIADPSSTIPQVGDSFGGLTLTRKEKDGGWEYRWVRDEKADPVNHPVHYKVGGIETIDFIEAKKLNYSLGNAVKYITRADHKGNRKEDLEKARWYINREIEQCN